MPIEVNVYQQFEDFAVAPEDIQFGEADSVEVVINYSGKQIKVPLVRRSLTITLRGLTINQAQRYVRRLANSRRSKIFGSLPTESFAIGLESIEDAVLANVKTSPPIMVGGLALVETVQLEYQSQKYL